MTPRNLVFKVSSGLSALSNIVDFFFFFFFKLVDTSSQTLAFNVPEQLPTHFQRLPEKFSVMIGTILYVFGKCQRHFKLMNRGVHPFQTRYQRKTPFFVDVSINWATGRNWQTKLLDT